MDFIKKKDDSVVLKPVPVKIVNHVVTPIPMDNGVSRSVNLVITGLGDNWIMYQYEAKDKSWRELQ